MRGRHDEPVRDFGPGPIANGNVAGPDWRCYPPGARAILEPVPSPPYRRPGASGWRLRFAPRWRSELDPLTGWTGGGDPLATIELRFPDRTAAEDYCRRQGLCIARVDSGVRRPIRPRLFGDPPPVLCCSPTGPHALCCGRYPVARDPRGGGDELAMAG
ncbi:NADH dehydrogenase ubiquinone Fe-S protein 4 [Sphingopyxis sp. 22461]|uniref:NADH dehydrogenase ubiquinone Fe-S protein 4 n=1 Tax=Sphingopyxis sp. 22461 TaxID=3453923 RepID=UPI003F843F1E